MKCKCFLRKMSPDWKDGGAVVKVTSPPPQQIQFQWCEIWSNLSSSMFSTKCLLDHNSLPFWIFLFFFLQNLKAFWKVDHHRTRPNVLNTQLQLKVLSDNKGHHDFECAFTKMIECGIQPSDEDGFTPPLNRIKVAKVTFSNRWVLWV